MLQYIIFRELPPLQMIKEHIRIWVSSQTFTGGSFTPLKTMPLTLFSLRVHSNSLKLCLMRISLLGNSTSEVSDVHAFSPAWMTFWQKGAATHFRSGEEQSCVLHLQKCFSLVRHNPSKSVLLVSDLLRQSACSTTSFQM